jgi:hypothetical protein
LYDCVCSFGYTFTGGTCAEVNVCDNGENDCNPNATCNHDGPGLHTCACNSGYSGDGTTCADTNGCSEAPCYGGVECHDQLAPATGFTCDPCPDGFNGDGETCSDIDDCAGDPCGAAAGTCSDMGANAYDCDCSTGYTFTGGTCAEMVCIFTSVDGVDGWCPAPDFKEIVSPKSASDDAIEHNDAAACWELAQTDPDCVNKDAVSFDHTTGQCLCDKVADCQLGAHGPPTFNRFECS